MWYLLLLVAGFVPLIFGANWMVEGAASIARKFKVPSIVIGLTLMSIGTSMPELVVNVQAALDGNSGIVLGSVIGSNIFNIFVILGISAIIHQLPITSNTTWREIPLTILSAIVLFAVAADVILNQSSEMVVSRTDGLLLLCFFLVFMAYIMSLLQSDKQEFSEEIAKYSIPVSLAMAAFGAVLLIFGGRIVVFSAVKSAELFGMSERVISLTIIAFGTSLPELVASIVAVRKGETDLAVGNVLGSNILNTFLVLGIASLIHPMKGEAAMLYDIGVSGLGAMLVFLFVFTGKKHALEPWEGITFLGLFAVHLVIVTLI
jgi:cation:H+ antiporter